MISKMKLTVILIFYSLSLAYSFESQDNIISAKLLEIYGDDITSEQLNKVLEFDNRNNEALYRLAKQLDSSDISLIYPLNVLEESEITSKKSRYHYISILYRLGKYNKIEDVSFELDIFNLTDSDTIFYLSDSFIRLGQFEKALMLVLSGLHQYPDDIRFHELKFLIDSSAESLKSIRLHDKAMNSLIRLYKRVLNGRSKSLLKKILITELKNESIESMEGFFFNYTVINDLLGYLNFEAVDGRFIIDDNCNTFRDGFIEISDGKIMGSSKDKNSDGIIDLEYIFEKGNFKEINDNGNRVIYLDYPYISDVIIGSVIKDVYSFHNYKVLYRVHDQLDPDPIVGKNEIIDNNHIKKIESYKDDKLFKLTEFRNNKTEVVYLEPNLYGWGHCLLVSDSVVISGVRDIDYDGNYDILEIYSDGVLKGSKIFEETSNNDTKKLNDWWKQ